MLPFKQRNQLLKLSLSCLEKFAFFVLLRNNVRDIIHKDLLNYNQLTEKVLPAVSSIMYYVTLISMIKFVLNSKNNIK